MIEILRTSPKINGWWAIVDLEDKKFIYKAIMDPLPPGQKALIIKHTQECLKKKLALMVED